jgi:DNA-binding NarL/FixJ family response regulator
VEPSPIAVLIVDDHDMVAQALAQALSTRADFNVVGTARTRAQVHAIMGSSPADVVLTEIHLTDDDDNTLIADILDRWPATKVMVLSSVSDDWSVARAIEAGCNGYLLKDQHLTDLFDGIVAVHQGEATFSPSVISRVLKLLRPGAASTESLTKREIDVLRRLADGLTTEQIATELFVSLNTVRNHVNNIIRKLNVHSRLEAVSFAIRTGLIRVS